jgi:hypothetical protein
MVTWTFYRSLTEKFANEARAMLMLVGNPTSTLTFEASKLCHNTLPMIANISQRTHYAGEVITA